MAGKAHKDMLALSVPAVRRRSRRGVVGSSLQIDQAVLGILQQEAGQEVSIDEIEKRLANQNLRFNTFDVREAVWRLVARKKARFTPIRDVIVF